MLNWLLNHGLLQNVVVEGSELAAEAKPDLGLAKIKAVVFDHGNPDRDLVRRGRFSRQS